MPDIHMNSRILRHMLTETKALLDEVGQSAAQTRCAAASEGDMASDTLELMRAAGGLLRISVWIVNHLSWLDTGAQTRLAPEAIAPHDSALLMVQDAQVHRLTMRADRLYARAMRLDALWRGDEKDEDETSAILTGAAERADNVISFSRPMPDKGARASSAKLTPLRPARGGV